MAKTRQAAGENEERSWARQLAAEGKTSLEEMKLTAIRSRRRHDGLLSRGRPIPIEDRVRYPLRFCGGGGPLPGPVSHVCSKAAGNAGISWTAELLAYHLDILASQAHVANPHPFAVNMGGVLFGREHGFRRLVSNLQAGEGAMLMKGLLPGPLCRLRQRLPHAHYLDRVMARPRW